MPELNQQIIATSKETMQDKFPIMVEYFLEDSQMYLNNIESGITQGDLEKAKSAAHTIKSSSQLFGAEKVSELSTKIEMAAHEIINGGSKKTDEISSLFEDLKKAYKDAEPELKDLL